MLKADKLRLEKIVNDFEKAIKHERTTSVKRS